MVCACCLVSVAHSEERDLQRTKSGQVVPDKSKKKRGGFCGCCAARPDDEGKRPRRKKGEGFSGVALAAGVDAAAGKANGSSSSNTLPQPQPQPEPEPEPEPELEPEPEPEFAAPITARAIPTTLSARVRNDGTTEFVDPDTDKINIIVERSTS
jgi:hypothetical protein